MDAINIKEVEKVFSSHNKVLNGISLEVSQHTIFGFLGPNGAGKTTLIKILTGILKPSAGEVRILGFDPHKSLKEVHQCIGVLTEHAKMYDHLTGIDNLIFYGKLYGLSELKSKDRAVELLTKLDLIKAAQMKLKKYSTGMRQRLSLARILMHRPALLFLDEPTSGLDPESINIVNELLKYLAKDEGVTIFLCTHQLRYAEEICDTYGLVNNGELLALGDLSHLRNKMNMNLKLIVETDFIPDSINKRTIKNNLFEIPIKNIAEVAPIIKSIVRMGGNISRATPMEYTLEDIYFKLVRGVERNDL